VFFHFRGCGRGPVDLGQALTFFQGVAESFGLFEIGEITGLALAIG